MLLISYVVVKGDTLWDISAKFFKDPWKWPQIWGYNKDTIKDPHWIYPGNVVYLDQSTHTLKVGETAPVQAPGPEGAITSGEVPSVTEGAISAEGVTKLSPRAREVRGRGEAIPMISLKDIGPFLARPLVFEDDELEGAPVLAGTYEQRQLLGTDDIAYAKDMPNDKGERWQIYRPSITFKDPDTSEVLGHEVVYLGDATVEKFGDLHHFENYQFRSGNSQRRSFCPSHDRIFQQLSAACARKGDYRQSHFHLWRRDCRPVKIP